MPSNLTPIQELSAGLCQMQEPNDASLLGEARRPPNQSCEHGQGLSTAFHWERRPDQCRRFTTVANTTGAVSNPTCEPVGNPGDLARAIHMKVGIGLQSTIPGAEAAAVLEWARRADSASFSSMAVLDRTVYLNYEPLVTLAAAGCVTRRIRLMNSVLLAPLRNGTLLAKQAASVDALCGGRLTLGLGIGGRHDDFRAVGVDLHARGRRFDEQLATMKRIWSGESAARDVGPIGPRPARACGPEVLLGGASPAAAWRVGRWSDGWTTAACQPSPAAGSATEGHAAAPQ